MDLTLADPHQPSAQISLMTHDETGPVVPAASIEVSDVDAAYEATVRSGAEIVHPLTDEPWQVRRFFVRDPDGHVLNILTTRSPSRSSMAWGTAEDCPSRLPASRGRTAQGRLAGRCR